MKVYKLEQKQKFPISLDRCWIFFSDPKNLQKITPPEMDFEIKSDLPEKIYAGQIIMYRIKLLPGIKITWVTEISHVSDKLSFVDEQRFGPYKFWHHQHIFLQVDGGMECRDIVHYAIPLGFIGRIKNKLVISRQLDKIFKYRKNVLNTMFGRI